MLFKAPAAANVGMTTAPGARVSRAPESPYDDPALVDTYNRLTVPTHFAAPARDLVAAVRLRPAERVLDIGTGTGVTAIAAALVVGPAGFVVGVDASLAMLARVPSCKSVRLAAARAPALPFNTASFDAVTASFVLSHVDDPGRTLASIVRVLGIDGRVGVTAWDFAPTPVSLLWSEVLARFTDADELHRAVQAIIPWERRFGSRAHLHTALKRAGLRNIFVSRRTYQVTLNFAEYLSVKRATVEGVLLQKRLDRAEWDLFRACLGDAFRRRFGESITYHRGVYIAVGAKHQPPIGAHA